LETIVRPPRGSRLWYDDRDIQALAEDKKDLAEVHQLEAHQIRNLTDAGYTPESVLIAVAAGDFGLLVHSGLHSVQLQAQATSLKELIEAGWEADAVIAAVTANDLAKLKGKHTGLFSVSLQAPGATKMPLGLSPGETSPDGTTPGAMPKMPATMPQPHLPVPKGVPNGI
jgi:hypothetical protein